MTRDERAVALRDLVQLRVPLDDAIAALAAFGWDCDVDLYVLTRADAVRALELYLCREMSAGDCRRWAEALEVREDLGMEAGYEDELKDFLFTLASPAITVSLTDELALSFVRGWAAG